MKYIITLSILIILITVISSEDPSKYYPVEIIPSKELNNNKPKITSMNLGGSQIRERIKARTIDESLRNNLIREFNSKSLNAWINNLMKKDITKMGSNIIRQNLIDISAISERMDKYLEIKKKSIDYKKTLLDLKEKELKILETEINKINSNDTDTDNKAKEEHDENIKRFIYEPYEIKLLGYEHSIEYLKNVINDFSSSTPSLIVSAAKKILIEPKINKKVKKIIDVKNQNIPENQVKDIIKKQVKKYANDFIEKIFDQEEDTVDLVQYKKDANNLIQKIKKEAKSIAEKSVDNISEVKSILKDIEKEIVKDLAKETINLDFKDKELINEIKKSAVEVAKNVDKEIEKLL